MKVLVDTCVWSAALRQANGGESKFVRELRALISEHRAKMIGPIRQETLSGIRHDAQFRRVQKDLSSFQDLAIEPDDYITAAKYFNVCRAKGVQGSATDFLICSVAVRQGLSIFTTDIDFTHFTKHLPIVLHEVREFPKG
jgi:hypothetical protein